MEYKQHRLHVETVQILSDEPARVAKRTDIKQTGTFVFHGQTYATVCHLLCLSVFTVQDGIEKKQSFFRDKHRSMPLRHFCDFGVVYKYIIYSSLFTIQVAKKIKQTQ